MRETRLKRLWKQGRTGFGLWVTLEAPSVTEIAAVAGLDWVVIDAEHGHLDYRDILEHLRAAGNRDITLIVRVATVDEGAIKRVLDLGADGIIVPQIRTAEEVARAVRFAKYPPQGSRGIGAERAMRWGMGMRTLARSANRRTLVIPMIEHFEAGRNFDSILEVKGVDAFFYGTCDYAASVGDLGDCGTPRVEKEVAALHKKARARKIPGAVLVNRIEDAQARERQGFKMIGIGIDSLMIIGTIQKTLAALGRPIPRKQWDG